MSLIFVCAIHYISVCFYNPLNRSLSVKYVPLFLFWIIKMSLLKEIYPWPYSMESTFAQIRRFQLRHRLISLPAPVHSLSKLCLNQLPSPSAFEDFLVLPWPPVILRKKLQQWINITDSALEEWLCQDFHNLKYLDDADLHYFQNIFYKARLAFVLSVIPWNQLDMATCIWRLLLD